MELIREDYLKLIRPYYNVDLIKVITGVRRSGKSVLMETIKNEIISNGIKGSHVISINLEDLAPILSSLFIKRLASASLSGRSSRGNTSI